MRRSTGSLEFLVRLGALQAARAGAGVGIVQRGLPYSVLIDCRPIFLNYVLSLCFYRLYRHIAWAIAIADLGDRDARPTRGAPMKSGSKWFWCYICGDFGVQCFLAVLITAV